MKNLGIIAMMISFAAFTSFGQKDNKTDSIQKEKKEKLSPEERAEKRTEKMTKTLSLTENQAAKVIEINMNHAREMAALHTEIKALKEKVRAEKEGTRTKIDAVLTDDQRTIVKQKQEERKEKKAERRKDCCKE